jgi:organic radical activating enzyme
MTHGINRLDLMIAYSCNLACAGCISLSDFKRDGVEPYQNLVDSINQWKHRLTPSVITMFGGEPCLHPQLQELCQVVRQAWPLSTIRLITNGYLLDNFDPNVWFELGAFEMQVSVHRKDHESIINQKIKNILQCRQPWKTNIPTGAKHKQLQWQHNNVTIFKSIFGEFVIPYKMSNSKIQPWASDHIEAHKICGAPDTPVLYKNKLYKCPAVANAMDLSNNSWTSYQPVAIDDPLDEFINNINCPEMCCSQCPDSKSSVVVNHLDIKNVIVKQKNFS